MPSESLSHILIQVIKSWQVIAAAIAVILYISLVNYAARAHKKPASVSKTKPKKKQKKENAPNSTPATKGPPPKKTEDGEEIHEQE